MHEECQDEWKRITQRVASKRTSALSISSYLRQADLTYSEIKLLLNQWLWFLTRSSNSTRWSMTATTESQKVSSWVPFPQKSKPHVIILSPNHILKFRVTLVRSLQLCGPCASKCIRNLRGFIIKASEYQLQRFVCRHLYNITDLWHNRICKLFQMQGTNLIGSGYNLAIPVLVT